MYKATQLSALRRGALGRAARAHIVERITGAVWCGVMYTFSHTRIVFKIGVAVGPDDILELYDMDINSKYPHSGA